MASFLSCVRAVGALIGLAISYHVVFLVSALIAVLAIAVVASLIRFVWYLLAG